MEDFFSRKWSAGDYLRFVTPSVLSMLSISLYMIVDALFIARCAGPLPCVGNIIMPYSASHSASASCSHPVRAPSSASSWEKNRQTRPIPTSHSPPSFWLCLRARSSLRPNSSAQTGLPQPWEPQTRSCRTVQPIWTSSSSASARSFFRCPWNTSSGWTAARYGHFTQPSRQDWSM